MGKYEYLVKLSDPSWDIPVPRFVEASQVVTTDRAFVCAVVGEGPYAVRSSCDGEDAYDTANAGRYLSLIGVPFEELSIAVERVRSSYGEAGGKVIIQQAIQPVASGVAFSSSPEGFLGETVISFGRGLGEGVVSDAAETMTYHLSYDGSCVWTSGSLASGEATQQADLVSLPVVYEVQRLCQRCTEAIEAEADVEFAVDSEGKVWILQARPITRIAGMGQREALSGEELLDSSNIVESYPGVVRPLTQSFASGVYRQIFKASVDRLTGSGEMSERLSEDLNDMLVFSDWHAYYRLASWYSVLSLIPFSAFVKRAWRSSLGVEHAAGDAGLGAPVPWGVKGSVIKNFFRYLGSSPDEVAEICDRIRPVLTDGRQKVDSTDDPEKLLSLIDLLQAEVLSCWDLTLFNDIYTFVWMFLAGNKAKRVATERRELDSMRPVRAMRELVGVASAFGLESEQYAAARSKFLTSYGDRAPGELKLETRTWRSAPESLDAFVASHLADAQREGGAADADDVRKDEKAEPAKGIPMRNALKGTAMRERSRLMRSEMFGIVRSCYDKIGEALSQRSLIEAATDVYYLTMQEVEAAVRQRVDMRDTVRERKLHEATLLNAPSPKTLRVCGPRPWDHSAGSLGAQHHGSSWREDGVGMGTGTSPGCFTGTAVIVDGKQAGASLVGKIIIAVSTDPGWAYLLDGAGAIVAERGSMLSHTAIISRELGIPSVVGVKEATTQIRTGDIVEVDGTQGTVRIVATCQDGHEKDACLSS